jgi:hypothetical protein
VFYNAFRVSKSALPEIKEFSKLWKLRRYFQKRFKGAETFSETSKDGEGLLERVLILQETDLYRKV